ncbi:signal peptidase complex subunit 1 isoform X1 [Phascolarctos cinereus]
MDPGIPVSHLSHPWDPSLTPRSHGNWGYGSERASRASRQSVLLPAPQGVLAVARKLLPWGHDASQWPLGRRVAFGIESGVRGCSTPLGVGTDGDSSPRTQCLPQANPAAAVAPGPSQPRRHTWLSDGAGQTERAGLRGADIRFRDPDLCAPGASRSALSPKSAASGPARPLVRHQPRPLPVQIPEALLHGVPAAPPAPESSHVGRTELPAHADGL